MADTLESILGFVAIGRMTEIQRAGIPKPLPKQFYTPTGKFSGDVGQFVTVRGTRRVARQAPYGMAPRTADLNAVGTKYFKMIHSINEHPLKPQTLMRLRDFESYTNQTMGKQEVARLSKQFVQQSENLRIAAVNMMLCTGILYFDTNGNLLPDSSGATLTVDSQIAATHRTQLNGRVTVAWSNAAADIITDLLRQKQVSIQDTGYESKQIIYGAKVAGFLAKNTTVQAFMSRNQVVGRELLDTGVIPKNWAGYEWIDGSKMFYEDANGTVQKICADDSVIFLPDMESADQWWDFAEGSYPVPTGNVIAGGGIDDLAQMMKEVFGLFQYAYINPGTLQVNMVQGDTFLPFLRNPDVSYILDCDF